MAYKVIILYQLYMPSYFLGTFTEYPYHGEVYQSFYRCRIQNHFRTGNDKGPADRLSERSVGR